MNWKLSTGRKIALSLFVVITAIVVTLYVRFNNIVSRAVMSAFDSNIVSNVYDLQFDRLRVNIFGGDVSVINVIFQQKDSTSLKEYPYINSSLRLQAGEIALIDVELWTLLTTGQIYLDEISIRRPEVFLTVTAAQPILFPFNDSRPTEAGAQKKKGFDAFSLTKFRLEEAVFTVSNSYKEREANVQGLNIALDDLFITQKPDTNLFSFTTVSLSIAEVHRVNKKGPVRHGSLSNLMVGMDSLSLHSTKDTLAYTFTDFRSGFSNLDLHTSDSLFHLTVGTYSSSYKDGNIKLQNVSFTPNISREAMQARFKYQNVQASGKIESIEINGLNYDSLMYHRTLLVDSILIGKPELTAFKDKTKPMDMSRFPKYLGQQVAEMKMPMRIKHILATELGLVNIERKPDSSLAQTSIERGTAHISNVTNLSNAAPLVLSADAYLSGKLHFNLRLGFSYTQPQFQLSGSVDKCNLAELNPVLKAYTPASITAGVIDELSFSGTATWKSGTGIMTFTYHDLEVDLALKDQAKWKSGLLAFAANSIVNASNPSLPGQPPRVVKLKAERDMNKGFVNIILKLVLNGVKETFIMSKENKAYQQERQKKKGT